MNNCHWFDEARFGMFIHWGLYAIPARGEWALWNEKIPTEVYNRLADAFCPPEDFSPEEWVVLAKRAGMRYAVLTTRHHDGFSIYDSLVNPFNSVKTAAKRDFVAEFVAACRKHGLRIGLYHSVMNWQFRSTLTGPLEDPEDWNAMVEESHAQVRELMTNYGPIDLLWYDGAMVPGGLNPARHWRAVELNRMVRELQPHILINDRAHLPEDFSTPEQEIVAPPAGRRWESCMTMNGSWGYTADDTDFKSPETVIDCLVRCARFGGNLLLNIGPKPDGSVPEESVKILETLGDWMRANGDSIHASQRTAFTEANHVAGPATQNGNEIYLHLRDRVGDVIRLDGAAAATAIVCLANAARLPVAGTRGHALDVQADGVPRDALRPVVRLTLPGGPAAPADMLGGQFEIRLDPGRAPILAEADLAHHQLPEGDLLVSENLAALATDGRDAGLRKAADWCPGFQLPVYACGATQAEIKLRRKVCGIYDILLGIVSRHPLPLRLALNGHPLPQACGVDNPGCPDTFVIPGVTLDEGTVSLKILDGADAGIYAVQLRPKWQAWPTERWMTIGAFPTAFEPRQPGTTIRDALNRRFGPEGKFDPAREYDGIGGKVRWTCTDPAAERSGFDASGVDFSRRCSAGGQGVCFARTVIVSERAQTVEAAIHVDWWANVSLNGVTLRGRRDPADIAQDGAEFSTFYPVSVPLRLKAGENVLLVKNHCGRGASGFGFHVNLPAG
ncbi:MAG: alpha-L-fucosidase [Kiritimatiellae bacterium]|nr:alpha-L-fucosidase [Kiritimatiellia bacterium]